jgi:hypothetical protein
MQILVFVRQELFLKFRTSFLLIQIPERVVDSERTEISIYGAGTLSECVLR